MDERELGIMKKLIKEITRTAFKLATEIAQNIKEVASCS